MLRGRHPELVSRGAESLSTPPLILQLPRGSISKLGVPFRGLLKGIYKGFYKGTIRQLPRGVGLTGLLGGSWVVFFFWGFLGSFQGSMGFYRV